MDKNYLNHLLHDVADGKIKPDEAVKSLKNLPYEDMGFANIDQHRSLRSGNAEVVFCQGKTPEQVSLIMERMSETSGRLIGTRADITAYEATKAKLPDIKYDETSRLLMLERSKIQTSDGIVAVVSAGTADIPVAEEAAKTAEFYGNTVDRIFDVGVAGIHRLLDRKDRLTSANVLIVTAGMEGALASVVGGLVDKPVIAVPTSVGYGASMGGLTALFAMLNSCALGVSVMNIDNGFGAGYLASMLNKMNK